MDFFQLISLLRNKRWKAAAKLAVGIFDAFIELMPEDGFSTARMSANVDAMTIEELCCAIELELGEQCAEGRCAAPTGSVLDILRPLFLALLKKILLGL